LKKAYSEVAPFRHARDEKDIYGIHVASTTKKSELPLRTPAWQRWCGGATVLLLPSIFDPSSWPFCISLGKSSYCASLMVVSVPG